MRILSSGLGYSLEPLVISSGEKIEEQLGLGVK